MKTLLTISPMGYAGFIFYIAYSTESEVHRLTNSLFMSGIVTLLISIVFYLMMSNSVILFHSHKPGARTRLYVPQTKMDKNEDIVDKEYLENLDKKKSILSYAVMFPINGIILGIALIVAAMIF